MQLLESRITNMSPADAQGLAKTLNADTGDDWSYFAEPRGRYARIRVFDGDHLFLGYL